MIEFLTLSKRPHFFQTFTFIGSRTDDAVHHWTSDKPSVVKYEGRSILLRDLKKGKRKKCRTWQVYFFFVPNIARQIPLTHHDIFVHCRWKLNYVLEKKLYFPLLLKEAFPFYLYFLLNLRNLIWHIFSANLTSISNCLTI